MDLEKEVRKMVHEYGAGYEDGARGFMRDLGHGGCVSGVVGELIYYSDTVKFYNRHKEEINALLADLLDATGWSVRELFGDKWDDEDPLALEKYNQNLLAWFGFEETAFSLFQDEGGDNA